MDIAGIYVSVIGACQGLYEPFRSVDIEYLILR